MDRTLLQAIIRNDTSTFTRLVEENKDMLDQMIPETSSTVLHLASMFAHVELVREIVKLRPDMVAAQNEVLQTPLHEAFCRGNAQVLALLLEANPWAALNFNGESQSALLVACSNGKLSWVKLLLTQSWLLDLEEDGADLTSLHVAVSKGHTDIVREILSVRPNLAWKADEMGFSPLHYSCTRDHLEITKMLLRLDKGLALQYDNNGYMPLHLAAINGKAEILKEFLLMAPTSFQFLTREGETVFHLTVRYKRYGALKCLVKVFNDTTLINCPDQHGNTILHLAVSVHHYQIVKYLINKRTVDVNSRNNKELTALDIIDQNERDSGALHTFEALLMKAGGKRSIELSTYSLGVEGIHSQLTALGSIPQRTVHDEEQEIKSEENSLSPSCDENNNIPMNDDDEVDKHSTGQFPATFNKQINYFPRPRRRLENNQVLPSEKAHIYLRKDLGPFCVAARITTKDTKRAPLSFPKVAMVTEKNCIKRHNKMLENQLH